LRPTIARRASLTLALLRLALLRLGAAALLAAATLLSAALVLLSLLRVAEALVVLVHRPVHGVLLFTDKAARGG